MELSFKSKKLEKLLTNPKEMVKAFGQMARKIDQRVKDLRAAETLEDMRMIPAARCHELKGNRKGKLAVDISRNYRLIFVPWHDPIPRKDDGGLNWQDVTAIRILEVNDYHNK